MSAPPMAWLVAEYHVPATYSCRLPLSSPNSALVSPAPGPATVRLALVRVGLELFGTQVVRDELFPWIRTAALLIRPPERVALSEQVLRAYKAETDGERVLLGESVISRQMAHAEGSMMVYLELPRSEHDRWKKLLLSIGYWGQASSFTTCLEVSERHPLKDECAQPLQEVSPG